MVAVVEHDIKPSLTFSGRVQARDKVDLRARVEGFLEKRLFNEGQDVKKGDLLFVIEQAPYKASIAEIKATIQKAQAVLTLADLEVARASQLVAREVGTQKRLDETTAQQGNARGELARQKAALEKAELDLSYTDIRAPLAGRIGRSQFSVGNFVGPASGTLATIVSQDPIDVTFPVTHSASKVEVRRVETGPLLGTRLAVAKGLSAGEKVITEGVQKVRPGQIVQATEVKPGA